MRPGRRTVPGQVARQWLMLNYSQVNFRRWPNARFSVSMFASEEGAHRSFA